MSNTNMIKEKYEALVEIGKRQLEILFTPATDQNQKPISEIRDLKLRAASLERELHHLRTGKGDKNAKAVEVKETEKAKKRGKK